MKKFLLLMLIFSSVLVLQGCERIVQSDTLIPQCKKTISLGKLDWRRVSKTFDCSYWSSGGTELGSCYKHCVYVEIVDNTCTTALIYDRNVAVKNCDDGIINKFNTVWD